ncbi:Outward-rectifier potassium channel TOK1 [Botrytis cinerea]
MAGDNSDASSMNNGHTMPNNRDKSIRLTPNTKLSGPGLLRIGRFKFRAKTDDLPQDWWVASTAFPLIAATIGPLANVLSISALVTKWRADLPDDGQLPFGADENGVGIPDPKWEIILNAISLGCGFAGNLFLLLNFMRRVRYIVALPLSIIFWYLSTGILIGILLAMNEYVPPIRPGQTWSQGFWSAVMAASLYLIGSMVLMVNMLGYFLGHYPQHFELDDDQRTLILQTMMFFIWLAGGAGVYQTVCGFQYADALYFCDVTILTVGFGDFVPNNNLGRGLLFPYAVIGIIFLGLMINSLRKFASGMSQEKIVKHHAMRQQQETFGRSVTNEKEIRDRLGLPPRSDMRRRSVVGDYSGASGSDLMRRPSLDHRDAKLHKHSENKSSRVKHAKRQEKLILLREEKDRFDAMRQIQTNVRKFKQYYALSMSIFAFSILWCGGATVFWRAEKREQDLTYFQALYFCYVSLLTIGYGDFAPKSNAGKPFFVVWSLIAIPTMTILISDMSSTVIAAINRGTFTLADWTIMPKAGVWHDFLMNHPRIHAWLSKKTDEREAKKRIRHGFDVQNPDDRQMPIVDDVELDPESSLGQVVEEIEEPPEYTEHDLARKLATAIKRVANDLRADKPKKYSYEEWVEFTRLIRFSTHNAKEVEEEEEDEGLVEWDWIGEDSPMLADVSESEWVLDRLCESLNRYTRRQGKFTRRQQAEIDRIEESERKHLHRKAKHDLHYPAHPGPRTSSPVLKRSSGRSGGGDSLSVKGGSVDNKRDGDGDDDGDEEVKRHVIFIDDADDKETGSHNPLRGSGEGNGGGSGSKTPTNSSSDVPRSSNGDGDKDKDKDVIEFLGGLGRD